jgi:hypothetical protein
MMTAGTLLSGRFKIRRIVRNQVKFMAKRCVHGVEIGLYRLNGDDQMLPQVFNLMERNEAAQRGGGFINMERCKCSPQSEENEKEDQGQNDFTFHTLSILGSYDQA